MHSRTESKPKQYASIGVKVTTTYASDGSRMKKPLSVAHMRDMDGRKIRRKEKGEV